MSDQQFGLKIRRLREEKGFTREQFCDDETELTTRQLARIESGQSKPTLNKISFIADRLGLTNYQLMPDYVELPHRYRNLKFELLRKPTYGNQSLVEERDELFNEIYDDFYDELPEEEQLIIDTFRSIVDIYGTQSAHFGQDLLDEYLHQTLSKAKYGINDLLIIRLFLQHTSYGELKKNSEEWNLLLDIAALLPQKIASVQSDDFFILRDTLVTLCGPLGEHALFEELKEVLDSLELLMQQTQDFQKKPVLNLLKWKYYLVYKKDLDSAKQNFEEALLFAKFLNDEHLVQKLTETWQEDCQSQ